MDWYLFTIIVPTLSPYVYRCAGDEGRVLYFEVRQLEKFFRKVFLDKGFSVNIIKYLCLFGWIAERTLNYEGGIMDRKTFTVESKVLKIFLRCLGLALIPALLILSCIKPTPIKIYGGIFSTSFVVVFLVFSSHNVRTDYARQIGQRARARNLEASIMGEINLIDKVKKSGKISKISGTLNPVFYNNPLVRNKYEEVMREKHPEFTIVHGPSQNHDFIRWAQNLGVRLVALDRIPKKHMTCVDTRHVRWETDTDRRENHIFYDCSYYGERCEFLFDRYLEKAKS
jgi:hypothetical protein